MPCKSLSASSIGIQTPFSTSSGVAPGYGILTDTTLVEVSGNISFFSFSHVEIPASKTKAIIKLAATLLRENHFIKLRISFIDQKIKTNCFVVFPDRLPPSFHQSHLILEL